MTGSGLTREGWKATSITGGISMPDIHEKKQGFLKGDVRGYLGKEYTRSLTNANVFVKIVFPAGKKGRTYSPYSEKDMLSMRKDFPDMYNALHESGVLKAVPVDKNGEFNIRVPLLQAGYIVSARVEDKDYDHTQKEKEVIWPHQIMSREGFVLEKIIIPVKDRWWKVSEGTQKGDPKTDPSKVPAGRPSKRLRIEMEEYLRSIEDRR